MGVESKWLARWFAKLVGKLQAGAGGQHQSTGDGAMHIGQTVGPVTVNHVTNHHYAPPVPKVRERFSGNWRPCHQEAKDLMDHLPRPQYYEVLDWLRSAYGTAMVKQLWPDEVAKLHAHVQAVLLGETQAVGRE